MNHNGAKIHRRVVKLGGSLLDSSTLIEHFRNWLDEQPRAATWLIVGGGRLVDCIRDYDKSLKLGETRSHWLAIHAMRLNAELIHSMLPEAVLLNQFDEASLATGASLYIVDPLAFMRSDEPPLPNWESWSTTSDSIAARFAQVVGADELVLLKHGLPSSRNEAGLLKEEYVDEHFFRVLSTPLRFVNLSDPSAPELFWNRAETTS